MIKAILLDIEGTTTPIDFVHKVLFPFAAKKIDEYVEANFAILKDEIAQLSVEHSNEMDHPAQFDVTSAASVSSYLRFLIETDRKSTPLKSIQGKIWEQGYESNDLRSEVFDDVPAAFQRWHDEGRTIAIYSSGSVLAQKLLFKHTNYGDLTPVISGYFDTNTGGKRDGQSYLAIAKHLKLPPAEIMFVSDTPAELMAALGVGVLPVLSKRPGNLPVEKSENWPSITAFDQIDAILLQ